MSALSRLVRPRSIAVFGGRQAAEMIRQNRALGFAGEVWPVHPEKTEIAGHKAYRSVADLPRAPDAAFLAVNRHATLELLPQLARKGAGGAVCFATGFAEQGGDGHDLQRQLKESGLPCLGPNCHGYINYLDGAALWPDQHGGIRAETGIALITQSGNIGLNLTMQQRALPLAYLVTLGNQANVGLSAMITAMLADSRVTAIGLHIEGIDDAAAFAKAAARARAQGVPIVALKTGRSAAGASLTLSHTASLAGDDAVIDAFLRQIGVVRVASMTVLLETLRLLHVHGRLAGRDIASLSCSGGEAALIADTAETHGLNFRPFSPEQKAQISTLVPPLVTVANPFDYNTFSWGDEAALGAIFAAVMAADFALTCLLLDLPRADRCSQAGFDIAVNALAAAARASGRPAAIIGTLPENMPETWARELMARGIAPLSGIDDALAAIAAAAAAGAAMERPDWSPLSLPSGGGGARTLNEWNGKRLLAAHGIPVPSGELATDKEEACNAGADIGYPLVLKAVADHLAHKTELGAVRLNLRDAAALADAADALLPLGDSLLVESMIGDAVAELIVGIRRDEHFGLVLLLGSGGVLVELVADSRLIVMPAQESDIRQAIASLKVSRLIGGYRGRPAGDIAALVRTILAVQDFAIAHGDSLLELDINPLMVRPAGKGVVAADVLIRLTEG